MSYMTYFSEVRHFLWHYWALSRSLGRFCKWTNAHTRIRRATYNDRANILFKLVSFKKLDQHKIVIQETLNMLSIERSDIFTNQVSQSTWMGPIWNYLVNDSLLVDEHKARKIKLKSTHYVVIDGEIFRRGISTPNLKCEHDEQSQYVMNKFYRGICEMHTWRKIKASWVIRVGYY